MVRRQRKQVHNDLPPKVTAILKTDAKFFARKFHRNEKQVNEILIRIVDDYQDAGHQVSVRIPRIDTLLSHISAKRVLAVLKQEGVQQFREILGYIHYLENVFTALYTLDELAEVISSFRSHLYTCSVSLENTGYPDRLFTRSKWLDSLLNKLYATKLPANVKLDNELLIYKWESRPSSGRAIKPCSYDEADCVWFFKREDAKRLDKERHIVHWVKLRILKILEDSLKSNSIKHLWQDCLEVLTKTIEHEQTDFFMRMDSLYEKHGLVTLGEVAFPSIACSGGLWDIFAVIGHVEQELKGEIYCTIRERLDKQINANLNFEFHRDISKILKDIIFSGRSQREDFVEFMRTKLQKEEQLHEEYRERIKKALSDGFGKIVVIPQKINTIMLDDRVFSRAWMQNRQDTQTKKPIIEVNRRTRSITINDVKIPPENSNGHVGDLVNAITFALEECKKGIAVGRPFFHRKKLCKYLSLSIDTKMAHVFGGTPFWCGSKNDRLIRKFGGPYLYTLDADLDNSTIIYEPR